MSASGARVKHQLSLAFIFGQAPRSHQEIRIMESSQRTSGGFVRFFLQSIACLLSAPSCTNKRLASPNNQFAPYASTQHHLWLPRSGKTVGRWRFSQVGVKSSCHSESRCIFDLEDVQTCIWWSEGQTTCKVAFQRLESQRRYRAVGYSTSVVSPSAKRPVVLWQLSLRMWELWITLLWIGQLFQLLLTTFTFGTQLLLWVISLQGVVPLILK